MLFNLILFVVRRHFFFFIERKIGVASYFIRTHHLITKQVAPSRSPKGEAKIKTLKELLDSDRDSVQCRRFIIEGSYKYPVKVMCVYTCISVSHFTLIFVRAYIRAAGTGVINVEEERGRKGRIRIRECERGSREKVEKKNWFNLFRFMCGKEEYMRASCTLLYRGRCSLEVRFTFISFDKLSQETETIWCNMCWTLIHIFSHLEPIFAF